MENISILDQIINNQRAEEVDNLDAIEIINNLFGELNERERDILIRRYGLHSGKRETLESIGSAHTLTRERIRQIETSSVKKLQQLKNLENYINNLKRVINQLLEEHGGLMEKEYLLEILTNFSAKGFNSKNKERDVHKNYLNFMITKLLHREFEELNSSKHFKPSYKLKYLDIQHFEELAEELLDILHIAKNIHTTEQLIALIRKMETFQKHKEKLEIESGLDIAKVLAHEYFDEDPDTINNNKAIYALLKASKKVEQNKFGHWGVHNWREIKPKTINDKIYLVLKNHSKPLHFAKISEIINEIAFDHKKANAATVHNELILDSKYVLVGRGLYGLKEWGYKKGTVSDVIEEILADEKDPITRDEILQKVLERRMVKKATIILALMSKDKFEKVNGKYQLKKKS
jgi:hypothetical protein